MPDLTLWGASTPRTMRPHWALCELDLEYEKRLVAPRSGELQSAELQSLNPREKVPFLQDGDLICIDSGAAFDGYTADVTRTFPISGTFTARQREIYELVLRAEVATIKAVKPGVTPP